MGKTVLLIEFDTLAREAGWVSTDVHEVGSQADFRTTFSETAFAMGFTTIAQQPKRPAGSW